MGSGRRKGRKTQTVHAKNLRVHAPWWTCRSRGVGAVDDARGGERETAEEEKSAEGDARHRARAEPRGGGLHTDRGEPRHLVDQRLGVVAKHHRERGGEREEDHVQRAGRDLGDGASDRAAPGARRRDARAAGERR